MAKLLDNSTSTSPTTGVLLTPGEWKISLDASDTAASIKIEEQGQGLSNWMTVYKSGVEVALTTVDPAIIYSSSGQDVRVTRSGGSGAVTVSAERLIQQY